MCHGTRPTGPLGFNALQLSTDRDPNAIHGEAVTPAMLTLKTLVKERLLSPAREELVANPPRIRTSDPATRAVLGYFATNCGSCHNGRGEIAALGPILRLPELLHDGDAVARDLVGQPTHWQVPNVPEGQSVVIDPKAPEKSALMVRMRSRRPSSQMPPLGTALRDDEALAAIERWIDTQRLTASRPH
jgi:mono/diheme cytochrome c family protein